MTASTVAARRPPLVRSTPILGPIRPFLGDVLPFLTEMRATYGDAFRLRMVNLELTCLLGPDAIALLQADSGLRTGTATDSARFGIFSRSRAIGVSGFW